MKKTLILLGVFTALEITSQSSYLMGTYWTGSSEVSARMNTSSGSVTTLTNLPGVNSLAQGVTAYDPVNKVYFNYTDLGNPGQVITKIDAQTGSLLGSITTPYFIKGIEYNANTGKLVGTYWSGSAEMFCSVDPTNGTVNNIAQLPSTSFAQGETAFDQANSRYFIKSNLGIEMIDATNGGVLGTYNPQGLKGIEYNSNTGELIGTYWTGSQEVFASLDLTNGNVNTIGVLTGVTSLVQGETAFDAAGNRYFNKTNNGITTIDVTTGNILASVVSNLKGIEFIGTVPGCAITPTFISAKEIFAQRGSNVVLNVVAQSGVTYQWQSNPLNFGWMNVPSNAGYSGGSTSALTVNNITLGNHLQPFRVITTSANCSDTSGVSYLYISDTCVVESGDTLVLNLNRGGTGENNSLVSVYPNPTSDYLVIEVEDGRSATGYSIRLVNTLGREIYHEPLSSPQMRIDLTSVTVSGVYLIQIVDRDEKTIESKRIIIR